MEPTDIGCVDDCNIGGWISPDGLFFRARYCEHDDVAQWIVDEWLHVAFRRRCSGDYLEQCGWIRLETSGHIFHSFQPTSQQADILYRCYVRGFGYYKEVLYALISPIVLEIECVREYMPQVPMQEDQENVNVRRVLAGRAIGL